jgi:uncharacterized protein (DUF433 family)
MNQPPEVLTLPAYSYAEADALARVSKGTGKRWIEGYSYKGTKGERVFKEPVTPGLANESGISFLDLIEIAAIGRFLERGFQLRDVREIVRDCQRYFDLQRPLTTARFRTGARQAYVERGKGVLFAVGRQKARGGYAMEDILGPFLEELDYTGDWATKWWPLGKDQHVVIDPEYGFGLPVLSGSGVRTEIIRERSLAGDLPEVIAKDFNLTQEEVARALQFELSRAA